MTTKSEAHMKAEEAVRLAVHLEGDHSHLFWKVSDLDAQAGTPRKKGGYSRSPGHQERAERDQAHRRATDAAVHARTLIGALPTTEAARVTELWATLRAFAAKA